MSPRKRAARDADAMSQAPAADASGLRDRLAALVEGQQATISSRLADTLAPHRRVALINFPNHHNAGDPAIWLGTRAFLRSAGVRVTYECDWRTYDRRRLAHAVRRGTSAVLVCGGGNLGDVYPAQSSRERVLVDFPSVPVIQLPQSVLFRSPSNADAFTRLAQDHGAFTLFVRDEASLEWAATRGIPAQLCPDMAMALGTIPRPRQPDTDVLWLRRIDDESPDADAAKQAVKSGDAVDWLAARGRDVLPGRLGQRLQDLNRRHGTQVPESPGAVARAVRRQLPRTYRTLATQRLAYGLSLLSRGKVVVSDRLHGHLLAILLGIPTVALDNENGKVASYVRTWFAHEDDAVRLASSHEQAATMAQELRAKLEGT